MDNLDYFDRLDEDRDSDDPDTDILEERARKRRRWHQYDPACGCDRCDPPEDEPELSEEDDDNEV